jgi:2-polyprenyl-6-methoxyphenol hydroxylase-like FAD-dependent oxidoreductase
VLPIGHIWEHKTGATLIGDASHLMGPWAGEGVNLAMWDSLLLSHAIIKAYEMAGQSTASFQNSLDPLLRDFEVEMVARCKEKAEESVNNREMMFAENGAERFVNFFHAAYGEVESRLE